jgi:CubicO group peptidase (beta-lactamase class C family)
MTFGLAPEPKRTGGASGSMHIPRSPGRNFLALCCATIALLAACAGRSPSGGVEHAGAAPVQTAPALHRSDIVPRFAGAPPSQETDAIDRVFAEFVSPATPGCAVAASSEGRSLFSRAYGLADLEHAVPITPSTVFEAGSVAKQFAAAAILLLVQDGALSLHDDVRTYVPELPDYGTPITLDHLLTHTSGLREWGEIADLGGRIPAVEGDALEILARQRGLNFQPGAQFGYVGSGFTLAAVIVRRVTGTSLAQFSRARIFDTLGMTSTQWRDDHRRVIEHRATAYRSVGAEYIQLMPPGWSIYGHGGLLTTTGDLLIWSEAVAGGRLGDLVSAELQREAHLGDGRATGYGRGVFVGSYAGRREVHHDGGYGAYRAWLARYHESDLSIALLCNTITPNIVALGRRIIDIVMPDRTATGAPASQAAGADMAPAPVLRNVEDYTGVFLSDKTGLPIILSAEGGRLEADGHLLQILASGHFRVRWGELVFESRDLVRLTRPDGERIALRRVVGPALTAAELAALAGRYHSDEALATYTVSIEEGRLVLRLLGRPSHVYTFDAVARDVFAAPAMVVRFDRAADGNVTSFRFTVPRVRDLQFHPLPPLDSERYKP